VPSATTQRPPWAAPVLFIAPPPPRPSDHDSGHEAEPEGEELHPDDVRILPKARASLADQGLTLRDVAAVLSDPAEVSPDEKNPAKSQFRRGALTVIVGDDGMVLRVARQRRGKKSR